MKNFRKREINRELLGLSDIQKPLIRNFTKFSATAKKFNFGLEQPS